MYSIPPSTHDAHRDGTCTQGKPFRERIAALYGCTRDYGGKLLYVEISARKNRAVLKELKGLTSSELLPLSRGEHTGS